MTCIRSLTVLGTTLVLGACVADSSPGPAAIVAPGSAKTASAFQQDQTVCQQHAINHDGYGTPTATGRPSTGPADPATGASAAPSQPTTDIGFMQCMAARGNAVQIVALGDPSAYGSPYPFAYPYPYPPAYPFTDFAYGYPDYGLGLGGVAVIGAGGFDAGSFRHNGFRGAGFQNGFHGGGMQNGFHGTGPQNGFGNRGIQNGFGNGGLQNGFHASGFQNGFHGAGGPAGVSGGAPGGGPHGGGHR